MNKDTPPHHLSNQQAIKELIVISLISIIVFILSSVFDIFEKLAVWTSDMHDLDEVLVVLSVLSFAFAVFSFRRWRDLKKYTALRVHAEELHKQREETYRNLFEHIPDIAWTADEQGNAIFISPNIESIYGFTQAEIYKEGDKLWTKRIHFHDVKKVLEAYQLLFNENKPFDIEYRICHKNGSWMWWHNRAKNTYNQDGLLCADGLISDITERKSAEQDRDRIFNTSIDLMCVAGLDGYFKRLNPSFIQILGFTEKELLSNPFLDIVHPEDREATINEVIRMTGGDTVINFENRCRCSDGTYKLFLWTAVPDVAKGLFYATGRDITERKKAESERLRLSAEVETQRQRLSDILSTIPCVIWEASLETNENCSQSGFVSNYVETMYGYTAEEWFSSSDFWFSAVHPDDRESLVQSNANLFEDGFSSNQSRWITKDNRVIWGDSQMVVVKDSKGKPIGLRGVTTDITRKKRGEEESRLISEIIQGVVTTTNLDELLKLIHQSISKLFYAENCFVALYDPINDVMSFEYWVDKVDDVPPPRPLGKGFSSYVIQTGEPVLLTKELKDEMYERCSVERSGSSSASWMAVPLKSSSGTIGVLALQHYEDENAYSLHDLEFLTSVGGQIALAIERKRAEEALKQSEQKLSLHFRQTPLAVIEWDPNFKVAEWNPSAEAIFGYSREEVIGRHSADLIVPEDIKEQIRELGIEILQQEGGTRSANANLTKTGETIFCEWYNTPLVDASGQVIGVASLVQDITERKRAEEQLTRISRAVENTSDAITLADTTGCPNYVNTAFQCLFGYTTDELKQIGGFPSLFAHQDIGNEVFEAILKGRSWVGEVELVNKQGDTIYVSLTADSIKDEKQNLLGLVCVCTDISERKRVEEAIHQANQRAIQEYEKLLGRLATLAQDFGAARELSTVCRALCRFALVSMPCNGVFISLYEPENQQRRPIFAYSEGKEVDVSGLPNMPMTESPHSQAVKTGEIIIVNDFQAVMKGQLVVHLNLDINPSLPKSSLVVPMKMRGKVLGAIEIQSVELAAFIPEHATAMRMAANLAANMIENVRLIEREREQQEQLRQSQRMEAVGRLAGGVAHDFNNLLTVISGYTELSLNKLNESNPLYRNLEQTKKASERAESLTRQLLAFSRKQVLQPKVLDLNQIVVNTEKLLTRLIGEDIEFDTDLAKNLGCVKTDPGQIEQVLMNLCVNARDAMPTGGKITIETANIHLDEEYSRKHIGVPSGHYIMLAVSDNGIGMDIETQKRIFEPFFTTKELGHGTGLGLSTVYGIVTQSEGYIWVYSEVGYGTTFKVYLPRVDVAIENYNQETESTTTPRGTETILLAEDEEMVRKLTRDVLESNGYTVIEAADGNSALSLCQQYEKPIHLLVTDVVMPLISGRELAERLVGLRPNIKVLYMSGYTDNIIAKHNILDEATNFIQKPFSTIELLRQVRQIIGESDD